MKHLKKTITLILCLVLSLQAAAVFAYAADDSVSRVSCCVYGEGKSGRGFCWYTGEESKAQLQIAKTENFDGTFGVAKIYEGTCERYKGRYVHKVYVKDLEPGTEYTYRVGDGEKQLWSENCTFKTDDGDSKFAFMTIADVQAGNDKDFLQAALQTEKGLDTFKDMEFIVNLGDFINDNNNDQWDNYFERFSSIHNRYTYAPVPGNHDGLFSSDLIKDPGMFRFTNMFALDTDNAAIPGSVNYSFDYGNAHFVVLNTNDMWPMSAEQKSWLINDMSSSNADWKIVLSHRSLYSAGKNINKPDTVIMRENLIPLIDALDIDMVLSGHDHMYLRTAPVKGDKLTETNYVTEVYNGKETVFALDPEGTVYALPSTMGTKRYTVNENAMPPILDVADVKFSTRDKGGCFCRIEIDGNRLIYSAYIVNDETMEVEQVDSYAIKKSSISQTVPVSPNGLVEENPVKSFVEALLIALKSYIKLLFSLMIK